MIQQNIYIRGYSPSDLAATAALFFESVRYGAAAHYTEEQRKAWAPEMPDLGEWCDRLTDMHTWIAAVEGRMVGFMSLTKAGHIEFAFIHPDWMGRGVAGELYEFAEQYALAKGMSALTSDASLFARPFFERQGWKVIKEQQPVRNGIALTNFRMEKKLRDSDLRS